MPLATLALIAALLPAHHFPWLASAPTQALTVVNTSGVSPTTVARAKQALIDQSYQLNFYWGTPIVTFKAGGWPVHLVPSLDCNPACSGYHSYDSNSPFAMVNTTMHPWTGTFSHEILEMLVDPYGGGPEVCDPVSWVLYKLDGVNVNDFALPGYFEPWHSGEKLDYLGTLIAP